MKQNIEGIIVNGTLFNVKNELRIHETSCEKCAFDEQDADICFFCKDLIGEKGYFVESEKKIKHEKEVLR